MKPPKPKKPAPASRCSKCVWIHEADSIAGTSFLGVGLCPLHSAAPDLLAACEEGLSALQDIINAAGNGQPYTPKELEKLFIKAVDMQKAAILKAAGSLCEQGERKQGRKS